MQVKEIRLLTADEIECRAQTVKQDCCSLLLYKNARVDMTILDETFGPMNWQRRHTRDNANCVISVWDDDKKCWVEKEDTGTESNTEKEKGLASDSFKRAGTNWGIGRELYSAPSIWIKTEPTDYGRDGKLKTRFDVTEIGYSEDRRITRLVIGDNKGKTRFSFGKAFPKQEQNGSKADQSNEEPKTEIDKVCELCKKYGVMPSSIAEAYHKQYITDLTDEMCEDAIKKLNKKYGGTK